MSTRKRKLTRDERKQIETAIARAKGTDKKELSAQDSMLCFSCCGTLV